MGRSPCSDQKKLGLKKGPWTLEEDQKLVAFIDQHGHGKWSVLPAKAGLQRCGKSCRLRWNNYLNPHIKRDKFSLQEDQTILQLHALLGNRWSTIASHLPKRTDNQIKNHWNTHLKKMLKKMGIDPVTHKPCTGTSLCATATLSHLAQWESARLQAEARLVRDPKPLSSNTNNPNTILKPPCLDVLTAWQAMTDAHDDHSVTNNYIPTLPSNDEMSFLDDTSNDVSWYEEDQNDVVADVGVDCGMNLMENYGTLTGHHGTGFFGEEDKNEWSNILMNLVTINAPIFPLMNFEDMIN